MFVNILFYNIINYRKVDTISVRDVDEDVSKNAENLIEHVRAPMYSQQKTDKKWIAVYGLRFARSRHKALF